MDANLSKSCGFVTLRACKDARKIYPEIDESINEYESNAKQLKNELTFRFAQNFSKQFADEIKQCNDKDISFKKFQKQIKKDFIQDYDPDRTIAKQFNQMQLEEVKSQIKFCDGVDSDTRNVVYSSFLTKDVLPAPVEGLYDIENINVIQNIKKYSLLDIILEIKEINKLNQDVEVKQKIDDLIQKAGF
jgi:hypothetical protein